jgi:hypothetical protein
MHPEVDWLENKMPALHFGAGTSVAPKTPFVLKRYETRRCSEIGDMLDFNYGGFLRKRGRLGSGDGRRKTHETHERGAG